MTLFCDEALPAEMLDRARAGEPAAQEALYRAFERPVYTLSFRLVANRATAQDLAQDTFVEVLTRLHQFEGRGSFAGWVRSIAVTRCLMHLRSPWRRGLRLLEAIPAEPAVVPDGAGALDLERALARLPDTARVVVWLHDVEGYTHAEIGALLGGTPSLSKSQLSRAHERLRELLLPAGVETPCLPTPSECRT